MKSSRPSLGAAVCVFIVCFFKGLDVTHKKGHVYMLDWNIGRNGHRQKLTSVQNPARSGGVVGDLHTNASG
jgi:hypothetical protein